MGYTHYWDGKANLTPELVADIKAIIAGSTVTIKNGIGSEKPVVTRENVSLNGDADTDDDFETFELGALDGWNFCKTGQRPYDEVVTAILLRVTHYDAAFNVSSDGDWVDDWKAGRELYARVFGEDAVKPSELVEDYSLV